MPSTWETYPIQLTGGLITNLSRLQHGIQQPGAPRILRNFEPSLRGGYRRVNGYEKYREELVPNFGGALVQGSGQTGTSLLIAGLRKAPESGDSVTVDGVTGTYTISTVVYNSTRGTAQLTLSSALASSPADKAVVTFTNNTNVVNGLWVGELQNSLTVIVARDGAMYHEVSGWSSVTAPNYGTVLVAGAGQTGGSLDVDGIDSDTYGFNVGDQFTIAGVELVYTVTGATIPSSGASTLTIEPNLASSPADNAALTNLGPALSGGNKIRFSKYNFNGTEKVLIVDSVNTPYSFDNGALTTINGSTDVVGAAHVTDYKNHMFYAKDDQVIFSVPFEEGNFDTGAGAGTFRLPATVTGMIVFREQLIIFTQDTIHRITGSSSSDFSLSTISNRLGCVVEDTIEEVGGDIMYMGPDGVRFLGATERIGDFNLALASRNIQDQILNLKSQWQSLHSVVVRSKSQYRIFGFSPSINTENTFGYLCTQYIDQNVNSLQWAELKGFSAYVVASNYFDDEDYVLFANESGYVYRMDRGSSLDGGNIEAKLSTPFMSINDPRFRKTIYKIHTYYSPESTVTGTVELAFDFESPGRIQPSPIDFLGGGDFSFYGSAMYGVNSYGGSPETINSVQAVGAGNQVSVTYNFLNTNDPFIFDTIVLEFATEGRL